jgi:hypothetical protein
VIIYVYSLFGSERQLMPYFLRHYAPECDRLFMLDGGCKDDSRELIAACPNAEIQDSPFIDGGYDEYLLLDYLTEQVKTARGRADWALVVDVDEFLYSGLGTGSGLCAALTKYRSEGIQAVKARGCQMVADEFPTGDGLLVDLVRRGVPDPEYDKLVAFNPNLTVRWSPGRHGAYASAPIEQPGLLLLHYRYFGSAWLAERNRRNYARRGKDDIRANRGFHCAPEHPGKYSPAWWGNAAANAKEILP